MHWHSWESLWLPKHMGGMGFRDIGCFNTALLAKQVWRIHGGECPLLASILKARYYKHSDVLNAMRGHDPSYTWRSLWGAKSLLNEGLCWRVGNGVSINPFTDKWIPAQGGTRSLVHHNSADKLLQVSNLINLDEGHWNLEAHGLEMEDDIKEAILSISLSKSWPTDSLYWLHTKDGRYTVKSGYWLG